VTGSIAQLMSAVGAAGGMPTAGAYLDLTEPDLTTVACDLAARGHSRAVVAPLLFHRVPSTPRSTCRRPFATPLEPTGLELVTAEILGTGEDVLEVVRQT
jgi:hypothetical protein